VTVLDNIRKALNCKTGTENLSSPNTVEPGGSNDNNPTPVDPDDFDMPALPQPPVDVTPLDGSVDVITGY
jgi:hypothetical protein